MSGGHFDYLGPQLQDALQHLGGDEDVRHRFPLLAQVVVALAPILYRIVHDIDWAISGDSEIENDGDFERESLGQLLEAVLRGARSTESNGRQK